MTPMLRTFEAFKPCLNAVFLARFFGGILAAAWLALPTAARDDARELYRQTERAKDLVVWLSGSDEEGSAVVFDIQGTVIFAMTAKHVIWRGGPRTDMRAEFRHWPGKSFAVEPERFSKEDFATVKIDLAPLGKSEADLVRAFPLERLGDPGALSPGDGTYPVGHTSSDTWLSPERAAAFNSFDFARKGHPTKEVIRVEYTCPPGHSGGALFDSEWRLIGLIYEVGQAHCRAWRIDWALKTLQGWKYDIQLSKAPSTEKALTLPSEIKVAIVDFDNRSRNRNLVLGAAAQDVISSALVDLPRVVILTRDRLASVRGEMALTGTQRNADELARFGRLLHADALITGSVLRYDVERRAFRGHGASATVDVYRMDISLMIVDVGTGRVTFSRVYDVEDRRASYPGSSGARSADRVSELLLRLLDEAVPDLRDGLMNLAAGLPAVGQLVSVDITSEPPGADVVVGGVYKGSTPVTLELEMGLREIAIDRVGYQAWFQTVEVTPGLEVHASLFRVGM